MRRSALLATFVAVMAVGAAAPSTSQESDRCSCHYQRTTSTSPTSTSGLLCYRDEDMSRDCLLAWAAQKNSRLNASSLPAAPRPPGADVSGEEAVVREIVGAVAGPWPDGRHAPSALAPLGNAGFWDELFDIARRSANLSGGFGLQDDLAAFLSSQGAAVERPLQATAAALFLVASGLARSSAPPEVRRQLLRALIARGDELLAFARGGRGGEAREPIAFSPPGGVTATAPLVSFVALGCLELWFDPHRLSQMVKASWGRPQGQGRCAR